MRTTIDLPEPLIQNAKQLAAERATTLSAVLEDALLQHLSQRTTYETPHFRLRTVKGRLVNPGLDLDRTSALLVDDDELAFRAAS